MQKGQGLVEYAAILGLVGLAVVVVLAMAAPVVQKTRTEGALTGSSNVVADVVQSVEQTVEGAEKALVADFVSQEYRGTAYGVYHGAVGLAAFPASLLFGVFLKLYGPGSAFVVGASLAALAGLLLTMLLASAPRDS